MINVEPTKKASKLELKLREELDSARKKEKFYWSLWQKKGSVAIIAANKKTELIHELLKKIRRLETLAK